MLKLSAELIIDDKSGSVVGVSMDDEWLGNLNVNHDAEKLVGLLNAAEELLHACKFMWRQAIMEGKGCSGDPNEAEYDRAKAAIDKAKVNKKGAADGR